MYYYYINADLSFILVHCIVLMMVLIIEMFYTLNVYLSGKKNPNLHQNLPLPINTISLDMQTLHV